MESLISLFSSALESEPDQALAISDFLAGVKNGRWQHQIEVLREHIKRNDRVRYDHKKRLLPAVTLSCHCLSRERDLTPEAKAITHSGWLQADFDLKDNPILASADTVTALRAALLADPHVGAVFVGPSGEGLKALVSIDTDRHKDSWFAAEIHFREKHGLKLDRATKDPMRLCFVSFDPLLEVSDSFSPMPVPEVIQVSTSWHPPVESTATDIEEMLRFIPSRPDYDTWLRVASAVWSVLPMAEGANLLNKWSPEEKDGEYVSKHKARLQQVGIGSLAMLAQQHGFDAKAAYRRRRWAGRIRFADSERSPFAPEENDIDEEVPTVTEITRERIIQAFETGQIGDADLYCEMRSGRRVWNIHAKMWMIYEEGLWMRDAGKTTIWDISETLCEIYKSLIASIQEEINANPAPEKKKDVRLKEIEGIEKRLSELHRKDYLSGIESFALCKMHLPATAFDSNPEILVLENGTLDFAQGVFRPHQPSDNATIRSPISFDPAADCPLWDGFLARFIPDTETRQYLARAVGYSLTGRVHGDAMFFSYGKGANGKSTFFGVLKILLGDLMTTVPIAALLAAKSDNNFDYHKASMEGKRVVLTDEIPEGRVLQDSQVKAITGGDPMNARRSFESPYVFMPTHKLWLMGNHKPEIKGTDEGIWRRVHMIPFLVTIPENERRPRHDILREFQNEAAGILNWAIRGLLESRDIGLRPPAQVIDATKEFRDDCDQFGTFLTECTEKSIEGRVGIGQLAKCYKIWCERNSETPRYAGTRKMRSVMVDRGYHVEPDRMKHPTVHAIKMRLSDATAQDFELVHES